MATGKTASANEETYQEFNDLVNMAPKELEEWLATENSHTVGFKEKDGEESVGHESGRKIIQIKHKKKADLTEEDYAHMRKVISYIKRHSAQKPSGDISATRWRYSLKNWGHDPVKTIDDRK